MNAGKHDTASTPNLSFSGSIQDGDLLEGAVTDPTVSSETPDKT
jgi:hypothetical protein